MKPTKWRWSFPKNWANVDRMANSRGYRVLGYTGIDDDSWWLNVERVSDGAQGKRLLTWTNGRYEWHPPTSGGAQ